MERQEKMNNLRDALVWLREDATQYYKCDKSYFDQQKKTIYRKPWSSISWNDMFHGENKNLVEMVNL